MSLEYVSHNRHVLLGQFIEAAKGHAATEPSSTAPAAAAPEPSEGAVLLAKRKALRQERRRLLALAAECDEALKSVPWFTTCADDRGNVLFMPDFDGGSRWPTELFQVRADGFDRGAVERLHKCLTGPHGRTVELCGETANGSWRAGVQIWDNSWSNCDDIVVSRCGSGYVVSRNTKVGCHFHLSHENLVDLLEGLIEYLAAADSTKKEGSK